MNLGGRVWRGLQVWGIKLEVDDGSRVRRWQPRADLSVGKTVEGAESVV